MKKTCLALLPLLLAISLYSQSGSFSIGIEGGNSLLIGDCKINQTQIKPMVGLRGNYYIMDNLSLNLSINYNQTYANNKYSEFYPIAIHSRYYIPLQSSIKPFGEIGFGSNFGISSTKNDGVIDNSFVLAGIGINVPITNNLALTLNSQFNYTNNDYYDNNSGSGFSENLKDGYLEAGVGIEVNLSSIFSDQKKETAQTKRKEKKTQPKPTVTDTIYKTKTKIKRDTIYRDTSMTTTGTVDKDSVLSLQQKLEEKDRTLQNYEDLLADHNNKINSLIKLLKQKNQKIKQLSEGKSTRNQTTQTTISPSKLPETANNAKQKIQQDRANSRSSGQENIRTQYKQTLQLIYNEKYESAIKNFDNLLEKYPNHKLAGNFIYWKGEAYFALRNYREAAENFTQLEQYPNSPKIDDALLMAGKCYKLIGRPTQARRKFQQLLDNHPNSEYAEQARALLSDL